MPITTLNYHDQNNRALSRSKIMDFMKSKAYFKAKHINCTIPQEYKKAFDIGNGVDDLLAQMDSKNKFIVITADGRTKEGKEAKADAAAKGYIALNQNDYEMILGMACAVEATDAYKEIMIRGFKKQEVLQFEGKFGQHFDCLVAMPDYILIEGTTAHIWDLKTAMTIDPRKYFFHCCEYGYFLQMSTIKYILMKTNPEIKYWHFGHITVEKTKNIWNVQTFELCEDRINIELNNLVDNILPAIAAETDFKAPNPSLNSSVIIGQLMEEF